VRGQPRAIRQGALPVGAGIGPPAGLGDRDGEQLGERGLVVDDNTTRLDCFGTQKVPVMLPILSRSAGRNSGRPSAAEANSSRCAHGYQEFPQRTGTVSVHDWHSGPEAVESVWLIVDDEPALTELLSGGHEPAGGLSRAGRQSGPADRRAAPRNAVVLDCMLRTWTACRWLRRLRLREPEAARPHAHRRATRSSHRLSGLEAGRPTNYVTKPFSLEEVVLRLRGLLRRPAANGPRPTTPYGSSAKLVLAARPARYGAPASRSSSPPRSSTCSPCPGPSRQVLSKAQILDHVWSSCFDGGGNLVEVYISSLRRRSTGARAR